MMKRCLAIDIGASGGRHIIGYKDRGRIVTEEIYRFPNGMDRVDGHLVWDVERLLSEALALGITREELITFIQHIFGSSSHGNQRRKRNKKNPD